MNDDKHLTELGFYERLYMRGHDVELTKTWNEELGETEENGRIFTRSTVKDADLALAYRLLVDMRAALMHCQRQFTRYGQESVQALDSAHLSLVERQTLEKRRDLDLGIARVLDRLVADQPVLPDTDWQPISTAPQDGSSIRVLGRMANGRPYVETTRWINIKWLVESSMDYRPPTHWKPLDRLPKGYLDADKS